MYLTVARPEVFLLQYTLSLFVVLKAIFKHQMKLFVKYKESLERNCVFLSRVSKIQSRCRVKIH